MRKKSRERLMNLILKKDSTEFWKSDPNPDLTIFKKNPDPDPQLLLSETAKKLFLS